MYIYKRPIKPSETTFPSFSGKLLFWEFPINYPFLFSKKLQAYVLQIYSGPLRKISKFHLISWWGNFEKTHSFRRILGVCGILCSKSFDIIIKKSVICLKHTYLFPYTQN